MAPIVIWASCALGLLLLRHVAAAVVGARTDLGPLGDYVAIAQDGYPEGSVRLGWFPGYPLAIRAVRSLGLEWITSAKTVAALGSVIAVAAFWDWMRSLAVGRPGRIWAVVALLVWPAGFMLLGSVVLSEGLFLALVIGACAANERGRGLLGALLLSCATLTRPTGAVVVAALVVRNLERAGAAEVSWARRRLPRLSVDPSRLEVRHLFPLVGLCGLAGYVLYCWAVHGDPFVYLGIQDSLTPSPPKTSWTTWTHWMMLSQYRDWLRDPTYFVASALNGALTVLVAVSVPRVVRRFGAAYGLLVLGVVALIWFGGWDFPSAARYLLAAFPFFALVGEWTDRRRVKATAVALSSIVVVIYSVVFHSGRTLVTW